MEGGLVYSRIDQEYDSDPSGGARTFFKPFEITSQTTFDEKTDLFHDSPGFSTEFDRPRLWNAGWGGVG